jgi:hypothetical protein
MASEMRRERAGSERERANEGIYGVNCNETHTGGERCKRDWRHNLILIRYFCIPSID